jgi:hypothetical protein
MLRPLNRHVERVFSTARIVIAFGGPCTRQRAQKMTMGGENYQLKVTVAAMKLLLGRLYALQYKQMKLDPLLVPDIHEAMLSNWSKAPLVRSSDAAISDVASNDVLREVETFLQGVAKDFQAMK